MGHLPLLSEAQMRRIELYVTLSRGRRGLMIVKC